MSTKLSGSRYYLPETAPGVPSGEEVRDGDGPLWALYCMDMDISESRLQQLAAELEKEYIIEVPTGEDIRLIRPAPAASRYQATLEEALKSHIRYGNESKANLEYFPYGFLVVHDKDWEAQGLWIVHVDFEDDCPVTAFRVRTGDVGSVCFTLREDDDGPEELKESYQIID